MKPLLVVLTVFLLAGCVGTDADADGADASDVAPVEEPLRETVVLYTGNYEAAPGVPAAFDVEVPEGAVNVVYEIRTVVSPGTVSGKTTLSGCGFHSYTTVGNIWIANNAAWGGSLCDAADAGLQQFTIEAGSVPLSGTVTLRADLPS